MGFHQDGDTVAQREIAGGEARRADPVDEAGGRVIAFHETWIEGDRLRTLGGELGQDALQQRVAGFTQAFIARVGGFAGDRDVVLELGAVGHVQVQHHQRIPSVDQAQHGPHFRRIGLHVVAVEVVALGGDSEAHLFRSALVGTVPGAEIFMAIDIEHRHEQQHGLVQHTLARFALQQVADQPETGILAVDFPGVDAALGQHHRQAARPCSPWMQRAAGGDSHRLHWPALRTGAEIEAAHRLWIRFGEAGAQRDHLVVAAGLLEAGTFGQRRQGSIGSPRAEHAGEQGGGQQHALGHVRVHRQSPGDRWMVAERACRPGLPKVMRRARHRACEDCAIVSDRNRAWP